MQSSPAKSAGRVLTQARKVCKQGRWVWQCDDDDLRSGGQPESGVAEATAQENSVLHT